MNKAFTTKLKGFFVSYKRISTAKNSLRPESAKLMFERLFE